MIFNVNISTSSFKSDTMTEKILQPTVNNYLSSSQISKSKTLYSHHDGQCQVLEQSSSRSNLQVAAVFKLQQWSQILNAYIPQSQAATYINLQHTARSIYKYKLAAQDYNVQCAMAGSYYTQAHTTRNINMEIFQFKLHAESRVNLGFLHSNDHKE